MIRIPVRSHKGNVALVILGTIYSLGASIVLAWFVADVHNAARLLDRLMQMGLILSAVFGVWAIANALENLGVSLSGRSFLQLHRGSSQRMNALPQR